MKKMKLAYIAVAGAVALTSCNDFLDKMPDNRVDPQTPDQLLSMMVDGKICALGAPAQLKSMCGVTTMDEVFQKLALSAKRN